jgi:dihydroorotate dehydrogenase (NAD+) catalytic subunit
LTLRNPVIVAAGTVGYGVEFARAMPLERLGAVVTKTLTHQPREGHPPPRLVETPSGMLNAVGLQNIGLDAFLTEQLPQLASYRVPIVVSILSESPEELASMVQQLDRADGVAAIELNLSCPNLHPKGQGTGDGGRGLPQNPTPHGPRPMSHMIAQDADATFAMVQAARQQTTKPVIAKLSPDVTDIVPIAQAAERARASALSLVNTFVGMSIDPATRRSRLGVLTGGLSGPAIRPLAVYRVWSVAQAVHLPLIGLGGVVRAEDALEFLIAGATAVGIGTGNFADPRTPLRVLRGIERYLHAHHIASVNELRGTLH